jgi:aminopeptidase N
VTGATGVGDEYYPGLGNGGYDVERYVLVLDVDPGTGTIDATATIEATATQDLAGFHLDLIGLEVGAVTVDGEPARTSRDGQELLIEPGAPIASGEAFVAVVPYRGEPGTIETESLGSVGWTALGDGASYVLSEPEGAATWCPANDHPSDKALFRFEITTPEGIEAAANGLLVSSEPTGDGRTRWIYEVAHPMATYLATVGIGDLTFEQTVGPNGLSIRNAFDDDLAADATGVFARQGEMVDFFDDLFGPYPFEAYGALVMDVSVGVALENQTMSFFGSDILRGGGLAQEIIAHELVHQWYGDSVALERWQDIWLNEGFATYGQWLWSTHATGDPIDERARRTHGDLGRTGAGDLPPGDPGPGGLFAQSVYERGALLLHELRRAVGDEGFFTILRRWAAEHADGNVNTGQFVALAEEVAGARLDDLFESWLYADELPDLRD